MKSILKWNVVNKLFLIIILTCAFTTVYKETVTLVHVVSNHSGSQKAVYLDVCLAHHKNIVDSYYAPRKTWKTSNLGSVLFKNVASSHYVHSSRQNKTFRILIWRHWDWLIQRHVYNFKHLNSKQRAYALKNILRDCSVHNCIFTGEDRYLRTADAVVVHTQKGIIPYLYSRSRTQRWIILNDESPEHMFSLAKIIPSLSDFNNTFNWTMSYRHDSDVPVPHGRTIALPAPAKSTPESISTLLTELVPYFDLKTAEDRFTAILMSNCLESRFQLIKELRKNHVFVDIYGKCAARKDDGKRCPGYFKKECPLLRKYLFYLSLENSKCKEYITEKTFYNAYIHGAIPVISGPSLEDCNNLLPPNSFLHVDSFESIQKLAQEMKNIAKSKEKIWQYHEWRLHFKVVSEDGYFGTASQHLCRVCEALNYNDGEISIYDQKRLEDFFDVKANCWD